MWLTCPSSIFYVSQYISWAKSAKPDRLWGVTAILHILRWTINMRSKHKPLGEVSKWNSGGLVCAGRDLGRSLWAHSKIIFTDWGKSCRVIYQVILRPWKFFFRATDCWIETLKSPHGNTIAANKQNITVFSFARPLLTQQNSHCELQEIRATLQPSSLYHYTSTRCPTGASPRRLLGIISSAALVTLRHTSLNLRVMEDVHGCDPLKWEKACQHRLIKGGG